MHNQINDLTLSRVRKAQRDIVSFDRTLDSLQQLYPQDEQIWDFIGDVRDLIFRLQQALHNQKTIDNSRMHQDVELDQSQEDMELHFETW